MRETAAMTIDPRVVITRPAGPDGPAVLAVYGDIPAPIVAVPRPRAVCCAWPVICWPPSSRPKSAQRRPHRRIFPGRTPTPTTKARILSHRRADLGSVQGGRDDQRHPK